MIIREAVASDLGDILAIHRAAFGSDEEAGILARINHHENTRVFFVRSR